MSETKPSMPPESAGTEITRFNALRHGVLSRYTVLPWEDADEYRALLEALAVEHAPPGPTEEHLVEELAGIVWRKRRFRLAELAAYRRGLGDTLPHWRETAKAALVPIDADEQSGWVADAIRATAADTEEAIRELHEHEAMTRRAIKLLGSKRDDAYEAALAALREDMRVYWANVPPTWVPAWPASAHQEHRCRAAGASPSGSTNTSLPGAGSLRYHQRRPRRRSPPKHAASSAP
jgi:hypothetical protein